MAPPAAAAPATAAAAPAAAPAAGKCPACPNKGACPPVKFSDLNKKYKDLSSDDFGFGAYKLTLKAKTEKGVNIKAEESVKAADSTVSTLLEVKYTHSSHGLTVKESIDTKSAITTEVGLDCLLIKGVKHTVTKVCNNGGTATQNWKLKSEYANAKFNTEAVFNGAELTSSTVVKVPHVNFGVSATLDVAGKAIKSHTLATSIVKCPTTFFASVTNLSDVTASVFHTHQKHQAGVEVTYKVGSGENNFNVACKTDLNADSFVKATINKKLLLGLAYTSKVASGVSLTLSSQVNAANLSTDSHSLGAALTFEN